MPEAAGLSNRPGVRPPMSSGGGDGDRYAGFFLQLNDAVLFLDSEGLVEEVNAAALRLFGHGGPEQMLGLKFPRDFWAQAEDGVYFQELLAEQGMVKEHPALLRRRDGSRFQALVTCDRGRPASFFALVRDVTQTRAAQRALMRSEESYRRLIDHSPDMVFRWNIPQARFDYVNRALTKVSGYQPQEIMANPLALAEALHSDSRSMVVDAWRRLVAGQAGDNFRQEFKFVHRGGQILWLVARGHLERDPQGNPLALEGLVTDITKAKHWEHTLLEARAMVEATLQGLPVAVMVIDHRHQVVHWNQAMTALTGVPSEQVVGTSDHWKPFYPDKRPLLCDLILENDLDGMKRFYGQDQLKSSLLVEGGVEAEDRFPQLNGRERYLFFMAAPIRDPEGQMALAVETLVDLSAKRRLEQELRRLSVTDSLTGLYNQRFFYATLEREIDAAQRHGYALSLLMVDLDRFKNFNDTYGHLEGDRVLADCARILAEQVRTVDLACRYGGEEFVVLLPRANLDEALMVGERIRARVAEMEFWPRLADGNRERASITVSVGAAVHQPGQGVRELVGRADRAMYLVKEQGRNQVGLCHADGRLELLRDHRKVV